MILRFSGFWCFVAFLIFPFFFPPSHSLERLVPVASHDALPDGADMVFDLLHGLGVLGITGLEPLAVELVHESLAFASTFFRATGRVQVTVRHKLRVID